jgi:anti-sigma B factor antagonist
LLERGDTAFLRICGELDVGSVDAVRAELAAMPAEATELIIDLRETEFIDSTGIGVLLEAWREANAKKLSASLVVGNGQVAQALETAGLDRIMPTIRGVPVPRLDGLSALDARG